MNKKKTVIKKVECEFTKREFNCTWMDNERYCTTDGGCGWQVGEVDVEVEEEVCDLCLGGTSKQVGNMFVCPSCGKAIN